MSLVKINAISVPPQAGAERAPLPERAGQMNGTPGFLGFQLLRPTANETATSSSPSGPTRSRSSPGETATPAPRTPASTASRSRRVQSSWSSTSCST
nr:antibiotic biosynthesis monooxygenase [Nocardioides yefusunii]